MGDDDSMMNDEDLGRTSNITELWKMNKVLDKDFVNFIGVNQKGNSL